MAMTALQMVNNLLLRFGKKPVTVFSGVATNDDTLALSNINLAQQMISTAYPFSWMMQSAPSQITAVQGTATYDIDDGIGKVVVAKHTHESGGFIEVVDRETLERYRPKRTDLDQQGIPRFITAAGISGAISAVPSQVVELWPIPDANFNGEIIYLYCTLTMADLALVTDISRIPVDFHWLLVDQAEILWRTGPLRVGGDQNMVDLYQIVSERVQRGLRDLISREANLGGKTATWVQDESDI